MKRNQAVRYASTIVARRRCSHRKIWRPLPICVTSPTRSLASRAHTSAAVSRISPLAGDGCATLAALHGLRDLAIPPAWKEVWICRFAKGHLQATGRDSRRRKQYVYHPRWCEVVEPREVLRLRAFGNALPKLRQTIARDLRAEADPRERVLAGIVGRSTPPASASATKNTSLRTAPLDSRRCATATSPSAAASSSSASSAKAGSSGRDRRPARSRAAHQTGPRRPRPAVCFSSPTRRPAPRRHGNRRQRLSPRNHRPGFTAKDFRTWKASALAAGTLFEYRDVDRATQRRRRQDGRLRRGRAAWKHANGVPEATTSTRGCWSRSKTARWPATFGGSARGGRRSSTGTSRSSPFFSVAGKSGPSKRRSASSSRHAAC